MLLEDVRHVLLGFILYISGVNAAAIICALKGSTVDLPCSAQPTTSSNKWYTITWNRSMFVHNELPADGQRITYNTAEENQLTLTINDLRETDASFYCCRRTADQPNRCWLNDITLTVTDLQVKVFPTTEGLTVTLMCSTSCPLTENPAAFIWYKNGEFLYEDWSPWYQELVSSEEAVRYSCAIKGHEELRAPEVSVDSVSSICFSVTYAKGRMCSYKQLSVDESCSIKFPRALHVQRTPSNKQVKLTCNISCPLTDTRTAFRSYQNGFHYYGSQYIPLPSNESFSCAAKGLEHHQSAEVCAEVQKCRSVNYVSSRICALQGSSVNISSKYSHPDTEQPTSKSWYKKNRSGNEELVEGSGDVEYYDERNNHHHILTIKNLKKNDSAQYTFRLQREDRGSKEYFLPGLLLTVTDLQVKFTPSAEVTEGQRVTLTCSTSCPLTDNTNYIWYFNSRPLTLPEHQNKHLLLDPVSSQREGKYSCAVRTNKNISSTEKSLTVHSMTGTSAAAAAAGVAALLLVVLLAVVWWIRKKRTSTPCAATEASNNREQVSCPDQLNPGPVYDDISAQPEEEAELQYSRVHFSKNHTDHLYSNVRADQPREVEHAQYAVINFRN